jgi:hypothetical protein
MRKRKLPKKIAAIIEGAPKGSYQEGLLDGSESWSGASLKGKARQYGYTYSRSRRRLLVAVNEALPEGWSIGTELTILDGSSRWTRELFVYRQEPDLTYLWKTRSTRGFKLKGGE